MAFRKREIIGLGFRARSGKDTVADYLVRTVGAKKIAFAEPLKDAAKVIFGWTDAHVYGDLKEVVDPFWGFTPRWALQKLGTEGVRNVIGADTWEKAGRRRIETCPQHVIVTDVRFHNEAQLIHDLGGELWRIDRPGLPPGQHASELAMESWTKWDRILVNNKGIEDLQSLALADFMSAVSRP